MFIKILIRTFRNRSYLGVVVMLCIAGVPGDLSEFPGAGPAQVPVEIHPSRATLHVLRGLPVSLPPAMVVGTSAGAAVVRVEELLVVVVRCFIFNIPPV